MMKRILLWVGAGLILIVAGFFWLMGLVSRPLYTPGKLQETMSPSAFEAPDQTGVNAGYWKMDGQTLLYHFENGTGEPALVLHGGPGIPFDETWKGLDALNQTHCFYYYHQRGCGKSTRPVERFASKNFYQNMQTLNDSLGFKAQLADIERIRKILGRDKLTLIGHSFGGFLATLYAIEFPDRVKRLILVSPADLIKMPQKDGGLYEMVRKNLTDPALQKEYDGYLKELFDYRQLFTKTEAELAELNYRFTKYYEAAYRDKGNPSLGLEAHKEYFGGWVTPALFLGLGRKHDYADALQRVKCPVLIIGGSRDLTAFPYYQNIPGAKLEMISGAGHFSFNEKPAEFAAVLRMFMD